MQFSIEKFGKHEVSLDRDDLSLNIDIWGKGEWVFNSQFAEELYYLWKIYQGKSTGIPVRSRHECSFGIGETVQTPTTIHAVFLCEEDLNDYEEQAREALKKEETYVSYKELRKKAKAQEKAEKKQRDEALKKSTIELNTSD